MAKIGQAQNAPTYSTFVVEKTPWETVWSFNQRSAVLCVCVCIHGRRYTFEALTCFRSRSGHLIQLATIDIHSSALSLTEAQLWPAGASPLLLAVYLSCNGLTSSQPGS